MNGINKAIIVGRLGQNPETRYTGKGNAITNISVATSEKWRDKQSGETQERTEWHRVVFFNRLAEVAGEFLTKGSMVYIEGKLQTRKWQDDNGVDRYSTEIVASTMQMLDSKGTAQQKATEGFRNKPQVDPAEYRGNDYGNDEPKDPEPIPEPTPADHQQVRNKLADDDFADDDIPF